MTRRLVVANAAEADILHSFLWCEDQVHGLGARFIAEVEATFKRLVDNPELYEEVEPGIRRAIVQKFPWLAFYACDDNAVTILAVLHAAQDPDYIAQRLTT